MAKILVASTTHGWKCNGNEELAWLHNADAMRLAAEGHEVEFFCAIETDARGDAPFTELLLKLSLLKGTVWRFSIDDNFDEITSGTRLNHICTGRNLAHEYAMVNWFSHILFIDTDIIPDADCIPKLLEIDHPVVGGDVGAYCMSGPVIEGAYKASSAPSTIQKIPDGVRVEAHWNTAGFLMLQRDVFVNLRWRYDLDEGMTDDPAFQHDVRVYLDMGETWVRKDVCGRHVGPLVAVEDRSHLDRKVYR